jgi:hypothetical protein
MRGTWAWAAMLVLAGCSRAPESVTADEDRASTQSVIAPDVTDASASRAAHAPGISVTAAPGVAFDYRYAFQLASDRVAGTQEAHAQACEKLGIARCRITGMRYRLLGENKVEAMLAFKLAPEIARGFGKNGIDLVRAAEGRLVDAEITGTDAGSAIDLDTELAKPGRAMERAELQAQRAEAARRLAASEGGIAAGRESLANTPMAFTYGSGPAISGFDASAPLKSAANTAIGSAQVTLAVILAVLALLGPPAIALGLAWLVWRRIARFRRRPRAEETA